MKKHAYYVIDPVDPTCEGAKKFYSSARCGEGYGVRSQASEVKKYFEKEFGCKFKIERQEDDFC